MALETLPDLDVELLDGHHVLLLSGCLQVAVLRRELDHLSLYHFARVMVLKMSDQDAIKAILFLFLLCMLGLS